MEVYKHKIHKLFKKAGIKKRMQYKTLINKTVDKCSDTSYLLNLLTRTDQKSLTEVKKYDWHNSESIPFTVMLFNDVFSYIQPKLRLKQEHELVFWRHMSKAKLKFTEAITFYKKNEVMRVLQNNLQAIIEKEWEPLELMEHVYKNSGSKRDPPAPWEKEKAQVKRSFTTKSLFNKTIENCLACYKGKCDVGKHKNYWANKKRRKN